MKKKLMRIASTAIGLTIAVGTMAGMLSACGSGAANSEKTPLVLSTDALDSVFNPFFYTSGADGDIVSQTMVGMLSTDKNGNIVAGVDEPSVALDYSVVTTGSKASQSNPDDYSNYYTDYYFAVKDNILFSDGTPLTIKDVLFNMYMYLDPAYTGSSTMYSVDIQGLKAYRTQTEDENQQGKFDELLNTRAQARIDAIRDWADEKNTTWNDASEQMQNDMKKIDELFKEELASDWVSAQAADLTEYEKYGFTRNWEVFLFNYGVITATTEKDAQGNKTYRIDRNYDDKIAKTKEALTDFVFSFMLGGRASASDAYKTNVVSVMMYYATASTFRSYLVAQELKELIGDDMNIKTVSGIETYKAESIPGENGATKNLGKELDILHIRINGEDPKAIQNFAFTVAPLHYYSSHANEFTLESGEEYFGVEFGDSEFMDSVRVIQVPLGAGPYRATTLNGSNASTVPSKGQFFKDNIVYFERNENFFLGAPKIKLLRFKVISSSLLYEAVKNKEVHYASPTAKSDMMDSLEGKDYKKLDYVITQNLGYGYIGINANYVHELPIRKAIMHAMNTNLCIDYYGSGSLAEPIYRAMSKTLDKYYPTNATSYYPFDETGATSLALAQQAGYTNIDSNGFLTNSAGQRLKFTFTIAGDSADHPAYATMQQAAEVLNSIGFDVTVTRDSTALSKLSAGRLEVWAAAWSSSSDPDMYQVYHKDSSATSILAWGFPWISTDGSEREKDLLEALAAKIEEGRETTVVAERKKAYSESTGTSIDQLCALDLVMELAVELPTYQRRALYVFQKGLFSEESLKLMNEATAFQSPLSKIWLIDFA